MSSTYYPNNAFYSINSGSNALYYFNNSQDQEGLQFKKEKETYIEVDLDGYIIEEQPTVNFFNTLPFLSKPAARPTRFEISTPETFFLIPILFHTLY